MKTLFTFFLASVSLITFGQSATALSEGAYKSKVDDVNHLWIFQDKYCSYIEYTDAHFIRTWGGPYTYSDGQLSIEIEYDTEDTARIEKTIKMDVAIQNNTLKGKTNSWTKEKENLQNLDGLWRITGRKEDNSSEIGTIPRGDRKTIKILSNGYFQWIAINPAVKGFYGTGGGKYTFKGNEYQENILFFSRDDSRVGHSLSFRGEIKDGDKWHHSGLSSKGDPIYEIWTREL